MGTPAFAVPTLEKLIDSRHNLIGVVTGPDRQAGRSLKIRQTPVKELAVEAGLPILQPESFDDIGFLSALTDWQPDVCVVVAFRILPPEVIEIPRRGCVNLHPSLLPDLRGAAPLNWALINGYCKTGLTTFLIEKRVDAGNILLQHEAVIEPDDDAGSLSERFSRLGADLILQTLDLMEDDNLPIQKQEGKVTRAPKITVETCRLDWKRSAESLHNLVRGLSPVPAAFSTLKCRRLKIFKTQVIEQSATVDPGEIVETTNDMIVVATGDYHLGISELQAEGKRRMTAGEFLRGNQGLIGTKFSD